MLIECMKNRSNRRNNIFFAGGKLYIGAVAQPEPKSLEQLSSVRKMPVYGSCPNAVTLRRLFPRDLTNYESLRRGSLGFFPRLG